MALPVTTPKTQPRAKIQNNALFPYLCDSCDRIPFEQEYEHDLHGVGGVVAEIGSHSLRRSHPDRSAFRRKGGRRDLACGCIGSTPDPSLRRNGGSAEHDAIESGL